MKRIPSTPKIKLFDIINDEQHKQKRAADQFFRSLLEFTKVWRYHLQPHVGTCKQLQVFHRAVQGTVGCSSSSWEGEVRTELASDSAE